MTLRGVCLPFFFCLPDLHACKLVYEIKTNASRLYVLCSLLYTCGALCVSWTNFCFNQYIFAPSLVLVEHSLGSNTNDARTPPLAIHSRHVVTKPLWWWGGWANWTFFFYQIIQFTLYKQTKIFNFYIV